MASAFCHCDHRSLAYFQFSFFPDPSTAEILSCLARDFSLLAQSWSFCSPNNHSWLYPSSLLFLLISLPCFLFLLQENRNGSPAPPAQPLGPTRSWACAEDTRTGLMHRAPTCVFTRAIHQGLSKGYLQVSSSTALSHLETLSYMKCQGGKRSLFCVFVPLIISGHL